jgi:uncharacterized membrane protein
VSGTGSDQFVYVAGHTESASGVTRAVRWKVAVSDGSVVGKTVLTQTWAEGVNDGGDVAGTTNSVRHTQSASLWRNGSYIALNPPKGGVDSTSRGVARMATSPTYVVGVTMMNNWPRAVVWKVK